MPSAPGPAASRTAPTAPAGGRIAVLGRVRRPSSRRPLGETVVDLGVDGEGMADAPAVRGPALLGHEQARYQRLEHAPAPWACAGAATRRRDAIRAARRA